MGYSILILMKRSCLNRTPLYHVDIKVIQSTGKEKVEKKGRVGAGHAGKGGQLILWGHNLENECNHFTQTEL